MRSGVFAFMHLGSCIYLKQFIVYMYLRYRYVQVKCYRNISSSSYTFLKDS